ncbi:MAG: Ca2+-dependent phosphoinositide-specific phospholipase C [Cyclobacteriaceae bacterium]
MKLPILFVSVISICILSCTNKEDEDRERLNHIQIIGSHNSYKVEIEQPLMALLMEEDPKVLGLDYRHLSIMEQLDLGIRGLELDVLFDPVGGLYQRPLGLDIIDSLGLKALPYDPEGELAQPGFKVFHIPDIDFRSHCLTFKGCLSDIKLWSQANPDHLPIIITINPKNSGVGKPGFTKVISFSKNVLDSLDQEISGIFDASELITPATATAKGQTLRQTILAQGWPGLRASIGKVMFVLDAGASVTQDYLIDYAGQKPMFVNMSEDHPWAGFFIMNDPIQQEAAIKRLVEQGFMVRTRSDANTVEARTADFSRSIAAFRSGAQLISTDYYLQELSPNKDFSITFENGSFQRCNPILTTDNCSL